MIRERVAKLGSLLDAGALQPFEPLHQQAPGGKHQAVSIFHAPEST
jgi:hypothetical protein